MGMAWEINAGRADDGRWWSGWLICAVCDHRHVAVCPLAPDEYEPPPGGECPRCASMSCVVVEPDDDA